jgi:undecaprenyl-diphosphatase
MLEIIEAIVLGIVQGLTEFLPVSSSGHLEIVKVILGDDSMNEESMLMTVTLHAATALSTIVVFWKDIMKLVSGLFKKADASSRFYILAIVVSMIPAVMIGLSFDHLIEQLFSKNLLLVGLMLLVTAVLLFLADRAKNTVKKVGLKEALIIGLSQAIAILPGISRSGATISTSVMLGIDREAAAKFSFLMVIPLILGKMAKDMLYGSFSQYDDGILALLLGFVAAFITGIVACKLMISLVKKSQLKYFSYYCIAVGLLSVIFHIAF